MIVQFWAFQMELGRMSAVQNNWGYSWNHSTGPVLLSQSIGNTAADSDFHQDQKAGKGDLEPVWPLPDYWQWLFLWHTQSVVKAAKEVWFGVMVFELSDGRAAFWRGKWVRRKRTRPQTMRKTVTLQSESVHSFFHPPVQTPSEPGRQALQHDRVKSSPDRATVTFS